MLSSSLDVFLLGPTMALLAFIVGLWRLAPFPSLMANEEVSAAGTLPPAYRGGNYWPSLLAGGVLPPFLSSMASGEGSATALCVTPMMGAPSPGCHVEGLAVALLPYS